MAGRRSISGVTKRELTADMREISVESPVKLSDSDVATLLEVFSDFSDRRSPSLIEAVYSVGDSYVFLYGNERHGLFDIVNFIQARYSGNKSTAVESLKFLFPAELSRGLYSEGYSEAGGSYVERPKSSSEETPTGSLDEDEVDELANFARNRNERTRTILIVNDGVRLPIDETGVIIGRSSKQSDYAIDNDNVSRKHARIYKDGGKYWITNYSETNYTKVDGLKVPVGETREILPGCKILLADEELVFM